MYVGRVSYEWKSGPKRGQRSSVPVTLKYPAKITIRGKDIMIKPRDGEPYVWGEKDGENGKGGKGGKTDTSKPKSKSKKEARLRDILSSKYEDLISERGTVEAGKAMAKGFIIAHNKLKKKTAKRALAKVYGQILKSNKAAHLAFGKALRRSTRIDKKKKAEAPVKASYTMPNMKSCDKLEIAYSLIVSAEAMDDGSDHEVSALLGGIKKAIKKKLGEHKDKKEEKSAQKDADKYRKERGRCPRGFRFNKRSGKCEPSVAKSRPAKKNDKPAKGKPDSPKESPSKPKKSGKVASGPLDLGILQDDSESPEKEIPDTQDDSKNESPKKAPKKKQPVKDKPKKEEKKPAKDKPKKAKPKKKKKNKSGKRKPKSRDRKKKKGKVGASLDTMLAMVDEIASPLR